MFYRTVPKPPLSKHVEMLWYFEGYAPASARERLLPTGTVELVFDLSGRPSRIFCDDTDEEGATFRGSVLCGPHSRYFVLDTSTPQTVAGIHFAPHGAARFFREPLYEMRDRHVLLEDLWGRAAATSIRDRILEAPSPGEKLRILEAALYERALYPVGESRHPAVEYALRQFADIPRIGRVTDQLSLSPRRFIELFSQETGLTPKLFCRVVRFQSAIQSVRRGPVNWSAVAADCGYFDQSHFNHDFRAFTGLSPGQYAQLRGPHLNHVALA